MGNTLLKSFHPESLGRGWVGTSSKPFVIGRQTRHGSGNLPDSGAFLAVAVVPRSRTRSPGKAPAQLGHGAS